MVRKLTTSVRISSAFSRLTKGFKEYLSQKRNILRKSKGKPFEKCWTSARARIICPVRNMHPQPASVVIEVEGIRENPLLYENQMIRAS